MVKLATYAAASVTATLAVVYHAFYTREQFYPTMIYLSTSKISLVILLNMALVALYSMWQLVKLVFLGTLSEAEIERLNEQLWRELMEVLFAMTIFRDEFNVSFMAMVTVLLFVKAFHWLAQKRVEYIEITPAVSRLSHVRVSAFMIFLFVMDTFFVRSSFGHLLKTKRASVSLFFAFEYVILATSVMAMFLKYMFYMGDMWMEGQWDNKAVYIFYLELVRDLLHLSLYLVFFTVIFINYGLPLHLVRELYEIIRNFKSRISDFMRYRKITSNMNERFPDATPEELSTSDATCIICRDEMTVAKKLLCGHLFHVHCLRSWLERQQTCPTCRSPVLASEGGTEAAAQRQEGQQNQQNQQQAAAPLEGQATTPESNAPNVQGAVSAQQARLQAAASAASQYSSSFVYPATGTINWCPMYVPVSKAFQAGTSSARESAQSSDPLQAQKNDLQQKLSSGQVYLMPVVPGTIGKPATTTKQSQEMQYKHLQQTIQLLQQQLNAALEMQKSLKLGDETLHHDRKGKAPLAEEDASSSGSVVE